MKTIKLTNSQKVVMVDDDDFETLSKSSWSLSSVGYAQSNCLMHRLIMNPPIGMDIDHINHNKLDNRKENLRILTHSENIINAKRSWIEKGTCYDKVKKKWRAAIRVRKKRIHLGYFKTEQEAMTRYRNYRDNLVKDFNNTHKGEIF